jgi:predicted DsbA family dithiol-disulfide isomerase
VEVERLTKEYDFEVQFEPFLLRPETPPEGMPARRIVAPEAPPTPMELRGESLGIKFSRGRTISSNSHYALEAAEFALQQGDAWPFHRRMFKAYFEDLEDIGQIDNVVRIATEVGLPEAELRETLTQGHLRERVDEGIVWSRSIGVTAIPTFVFNQRFGMVGAQEIGAFRSAMEQLGQKPRTEHET